MSTTGDTAESSATGVDPDVGELAGGSYELLRRRLRARVRDTITAAGVLDQRRMAAFGNTPLRLVGSDRLRTELASRPRDMVRIGDLLLLGYRAAPELAHITPEHVFAIYEPGDNGELVALGPGDPRNFLADTRFRDEFDKLHRFYGKARFVDLRRTPTQLLAAFRIGDRPDDVAVLRWAIASNGTVSFTDARGDRDYTWPDAHDMRWVQCTREDQRAGAHPTVSVLDVVFVGFRGGRLQLRVEDGTPGGRVELDEAVDVPGQSLADLGVAYAEIGEALAVRVDLYSEAPRFYLFGRRTRTGTRVDALGAASRILPGGDGVVFPGGYHLATTGTRVFDVPATGMVFEEVVASPNGEDLLYVFHHRDSGEYLLAPYNVVRREIAQVIPCHGFAIFADGVMVLFRGGPDDAELSRVHPVQRWDTPFLDPTVADSRPTATDDTWIGVVGNADLVAGLGDIYDVGQLTQEAHPSERTWEAIIVVARRALDTHLWLADPDASAVHEGLRDIVATAGLLVDEYAKLRRLRTEASAKLLDAERGARRVVDEATRASTPTEVVGALGALRRVRGETSLLRDVAEMDDAALDQLIVDVDDALGSLAERAADVLDDDRAFDVFGARIDALVANGLVAATAADVDAVMTQVREATSDLDAVVDAVSALDAGDPTVRTRIVRRIADVTSQSNRARAQLDGRIRSLRAAEGDEAFDAELALLDQSLTGAVTGVLTPEDCDVELGRLLVNLERIESRYGDVPERLDQLIELRDRLNETFGVRRSELVDERSRRTTRLVGAAQRLLTTVVRRAAEANDEAEIAGFFAADQMVARVRSLADELQALGEVGQAGEVRTELNAASEEARRRVRDRTDLVDADGSLTFGGYKFAPNSQPFEVVLSPSPAGVDIVITGTDYRHDVTGELGAFADLLDQPYPSQTKDVARAEYLAWAVLDSLDNPAGAIAELRTLAAVPGRLADKVRIVAESRHGEGYELGVDDHDAVRLLTALAAQPGDEPVLHHSGRARALGRLFVSQLDSATAATLAGRVRLARAARARVGAGTGLARLETEIGAMVGGTLGSVSPVECAAAAAYLVDDLGVVDSSGVLELAVSSTAVDLVRRTRDLLGSDGGAELDEAIGASVDIMDRFDVAQDWIGAVVAANAGLTDVLFDVAEAAALIATPAVGRREVAHAGSVTVDGLVGNHPRLAGGQLPVRLDEMAHRVGRLFDEMTQRWPLYQAARRAVIADARSRVDLDAHRAQVMSGFVRNRLIDRALLPLVGSNLARQIGSVDAHDGARSGLLVLTSPPGYGKTTLMAWLADRLGMLMVKVNGPALGVDTTSLDPADAPNAAARAEILKINLALQMGRNVVLFIDDVQFTSPELLSRFIPLADATRRIEGVSNGQATTYDLRGKRFAVVMAGNPYSSGGRRFDLPDMLVNRADVHNLGDVADEHSDDFALSYLENSLTACQALAPMAGRLVDDIEPILAMAQRRRPESTDGLKHRWDSTQLGEAVRLISLLDQARSTVMQVNEAYVRSAATAETDRTAPPFLLQGSYRNMARIAGRVVAVMSDAELASVVRDHYQSEAQTLTDRAEQNLLALGALMQTLTDDEAARWSEITQRWASSTTDPAAGVVGALDRIASALAATAIPVVGGD